MGDIKVLKRLKSDACNDFEYFDSEGNFTQRADSEDKIHALSAAIEAIEELATLRAKAAAFDFLMNCDYADIVNEEGGQNHLEIDGLITCRDNLLISCNKAMEATQ